MNDIIKKDDTTVETFSLNCDKISKVIKNPNGSGYTIHRKYCKISEFIKTLEEIKAKYGDIHIVNFEDEYTEEITAIGVKQFEDATVCFI